MNRVLQATVGQFKRKSALCGFARGMPLATSGIALGVLLLLATFFVGAPGVAKAVPPPLNLITNGSFEDPGIGGGWIILSSIPDWTDVTTCGFEIWGPSMRAADDGAQLVELDSMCNANLRQTVTTTPGTTYVLSYSFAARSSTSLETNGLQVVVPGATVDITAIPADFTTWRRLSTTFIATGTSSTIEFSGAGTSDTLGSLLDRISLVSEGPATAVTLTSFGDASTLPGWLASPLVLLGGLAIAAGGGAAWVRRKGE